MGKPNGHALEHEARVPFRARKLGDQQTNRIGSDVNRSYAERERERRGFSYLHVPLIARCIMPAARRQSNLVGEAVSLNER